MEPSERLAHRALEEALAGRALEEFKALGDPMEVHHRVQITSFGGSGTTALTKSFVEAGLDLPRGPGQWPHKHLRSPPTADEVPDGFRVVYPLGDPRDAVLSVFRRGIQIGHWRALHEGTMNNDEAPPSLESLERFVAGGVDEFALADHFEGWTRHPPGYPVMFVRFELIEQAWDELAEFVGFAPDHPRIRYESRNSDWRSEPEPIRSVLDHLYSDLAAGIAAMPAAWIV